MVIVEIEPGSAQRAPQDTTPHNSHVCVAGFMQFSGPAMQYVILLDIFYKIGYFEFSSIIHTMNRDML